MRITLELPDNTVSIKYITIEGTKIMLDKAVTLGMIVDVKRGDEEEKEGKKLYDAEVV